MNPDSENKDLMAKAAAWLAFVICLVLACALSVAGIIRAAFAALFRPVHQRLKYLRKIRAHPLNQDGFDPDYEIRAQQLLKRLAEIGAVPSGSTGMVYNRPWDWPLTAEPGAVHPGVAWSADEPRALTSFAWPLQNLRAGVDFSGLAGLEYLGLDDCGLTEINLEGCRSLEELELPRNRLKAINLNQVPALRHLDLQGNNLRRTDLSTVSRLEYLDLSYNQLSEIDLSPLPGLKSLYLNRNAGLSRLDLSRNPALDRLYANGCPLTELDLSHNQNLTGLVLTGPAQLDISANRKLETLSLRSDRLRQLISAPGHSAMRDMHLSGPLEEIDLKHFPRLEECRLEHGLLTGLDFSSNPELRQLHISCRDLDSLNLKNTGRLEVLHMKGCRVTTLDLSDNAYLRELKIQNTSLTEIIPGPNPLTRLDMIDLRGGRLPLSRLRFWTELGEGKNHGYARLNDQRPVLFDGLILEYGQKLDLSAEAEIEGVSSVFQVLKDDDSPLKSYYYSADNGVFSFKRPGRYQVAMSNPKVRSWGRGKRNESNPDEYDCIDYAGEVTVCTGYVTVLPALKSGGESRAKNGQARKPA